MPRLTGLITLSLAIALQAQPALSKPTKEEGARKLAAAAAVLKGLCDVCCERTDCTPDVCKTEAQKIIDAVVAAWNVNYGKGSNEGRDGIGGYLCWDWARFFRDAALSTKPRCWIAEHGMAWEGAAPPPGVRRVCHYWLTLYACNQRVDECKVMLDDGWFDGDFVHRPPWPGAGWPLGTNPFPPQTPEKESGIGDAAAVMILVLVALLLLLLRGSRWSKMQPA